MQVRLRPDGLVVAGGADLALEVGVVLQAHVRDLKGKVVAGAQDLVAGDAGDGAVVPWNETGGTDEGKSVLLWEGNSLEEAVMVKYLRGKLNRSGNINS